MCDILKVFRYLFTVPNYILLSFLMNMNFGYAIPKKYHRYEDYGKKRYMEQENSNIETKKYKKSLLRPNLKKDHRFNIGINTMIKYISYNDELFNTADGNYLIAGKKVNPVVVYGVGPEMGVNIIRIFTIFVRGNIYMQAKNSNNNTGLRWDSSMEDFGIKSELNIVDAMAGLKIKVPFGSNRNHKIYLGSMVGHSIYEFQWDYLSNGDIQETSSVELDSTLYSGILGYEFINRNYNSFKLEFNISSLEKISGIKYTTNLMMGYSYNF